MQQLWMVNAIIWYEFNYYKCQTQELVWFSFLVPKYYHKCTIIVSNMGENVTKCPACHPLFLLFVAQATLLYGVYLV